MIIQQPLLIQRPLISKELLKKDSIYLDAPVSGGEAGAQNGKLSVMIGGDKTAYKQISPILDCYSAFHKYMGYLEMDN